MKAETRSKYRARGVRRSQILCRPPKDRQGSYLPIASVIHWLKAMRSIGSKFKHQPTFVRLGCCSVLFEGVSQLVGQGPQRRCGSGVGPAGILTQFGLLALLRHRFPAETDTSAAGIGLEHSDLQLAADRKRFLHVRVAIQIGFGEWQQPLDAGLQLHKGTELRHPCHTARPYLPYLVRCAHGAPRIVLQLLQPERNLPSGLVDAENLDGNLIAGGDDRTRRGGARPAHVGYVKKALDAAAEIHERAEVGY